MYSLKKVLLMHLLLNDSMQKAEQASEEINPQTEKSVQNDTEQVAKQNEEPELSEPSLQDVKINKTGNETDPILLETLKALLEEQQESSGTTQEDIRPTELPKKTEATTIKAELIFFHKPLDLKALQDENQQVSQVKIEPTGLATIVATTNKTEQIILEKPKDSKTILDEQQKVSDSKRGEIKSSDLPLVETTNQTEPITLEQPKALKAIQNEQSIVVEEETKPTELPTKDETPNITQAITSATQKESTSIQNEQQTGLKTKHEETKPKELTQKVETRNETEPIIFKKPKDLYQEEIKTMELPKQVEITIKPKQILLPMPKVAIQDKQKIVSETKQKEIKPTEIPRKIKTTNKLENIQVKITKDLKATGRKQDETRLSEPDKKVQTGKLKQEEQPNLLKTEQNEIKQKDIPKKVAGTKGPALIQVEKPNYSKPNMMDFLKLYNIRRMKQQQQISLGKPKDFEVLQASQVIGTTKEEIKPSEVTKQFKTKAEPEPILLTKTNDSETIPDKQLNISKTKQEEIEPREGNRINYFYNETKKQKQNPIERFKRPQKPETIMKVINEIKMLKYRT